VGATTRRDARGHSHTLPNPGLFPNSGKALATETLILSVFIVGKAAIIPLFLKKADADRLSAGRTVEGRRPPPTRNAAVASSRSIGHAAGWGRASRQKPSRHSGWFQEQTALR
jgi:hypothetical protein